MIGPALGGHRPEAQHGAHGDGGDDGLYGDEGGGVAGAADALAEDEGCNLQEPRSGRGGGRRRAAGRGRRRSGGIKWRRSELRVVPEPVTAMTEGSAAQQPLLAPNYGVAGTRGSDVAEDTLKLARTSKHN